MKLEIKAPAKYKIKTPTAKESGPSHQEEKNAPMVEFFW